MCNAFLAAFQLAKKGLVGVKLQEHGTLEHVTGFYLNFAFHNFIFCLFQDLL